MLCLQCHGTKRYWSFFKHCRLPCKVCNETGEVYDYFPRNRFDRLSSEKLYEGTRAKPSIRQFFNT